LHCFGRGARIKNNRVLDLISRFFAFSDFMPRRWGAKAAKRARKNIARRKKIPHRAVSGRIIRARVAVNQGPAYRVVAGEKVRLSPGESAKHAYRRLERQSGRPGLFKGRRQGKA